MKRSTSATSSLLASRASRAVASKVLTATLKVSLPFILTYCCRPASMASDAGRREPPPGTHTKSQRSPSECKWVDRTPRSSSEGSSKAAPAPSPNRMQVLRSVQSVTLDEAGRRRQGHVRGAGGDQDEVEVGRLPPARRQRRAGRLSAQIGAGHA